MAHRGTDLGEVLEALNEKMDRDADNRTDNHQYVVASYHNGASGYRKWSDGLIEQWGHIFLEDTPKKNDTWFTVNFSIPFKNTNYNIQITPAITGANLPDRATHRQSASNKSASSFMILTYSTAVQTECDWYAFGY